MSLEDVRSEFYTALEGLKEVHTREALEEQKKKIDVAKARLLKVDKDFVAMLERNKRQAKMRSDQARAEYKSEYRSKYDSIRRDATRKASQIRMKGKMMRLESPIITQGINNISFEALKEKVETKLVCPICKEKDRGNIVNEKPTCMTCMHDLVPDSDLKKYNREYRRKWKKKRK